MHSVVTSENAPFCPFEASRNNLPETLAVPCHFAVYSVKGETRSPIGQQGKMPLRFVLPLSLHIADG